MNPDLVEAGVLLRGEDPAAVDAACAVLMGFDLERLPIVREAFKTRGWPVATLGPGQVRLVSDVPAWSAPLSTLFRFRPHFGWAGHLEAAWRALPDAARS